ncbi:PLDc N-terminal domain-containing protein [Arenibacter amylolyticus]|uniref:PLDc N-terminal domain-containing protein n=2 Tax=Arenibacter TaxID=178469 RepID=UPI000A393E42
MTIFMVLTVFTVVFWLWALVDIFQSNFKNLTIKRLWFLLIFLLPILGAIIYFLFGKIQIENIKEL